MDTIELKWKGPFKRGNFSELPSSRHSCVYIWLLKLEGAIVLRGGESDRTGGMAARANEHLRDYCAGQYWRYMEDKLDERSKPLGVTTFDTIDEWIERAVHHVKNIEFYFADCSAEKRERKQVEKELIWQLLELAKRKNGVLCDNPLSHAKGHGKYELHHTFTKQSEAFVKKYLATLNG
jgi:hypothetical protein